MATGSSVIGHNVEIMDGPKLAGQRLGTLKVDAEGLHFRSRLLVAAYHWDVAWQDVADLQIGTDVARRWSNVLPMKVAHRAVHITVLDTSGRQQGFVVPKVTAERVHNLLMPTMAYWNQGNGPRQTDNQ